MVIMSISFPFSKEVQGECPCCKKEVIWKGTQAFSVKHHDGSIQCIYYFECSECHKRSRETWSRYFNENQKDYILIPKVEYDI